MNPIEVLFNTPWLRLLRRGKYVFVSRREPNTPVKPDAVVIIAWHVDENGKRRLVVIDEFRPVINEWHLGLPAGLIDSGEDPVTAAARELKEETGLDANLPAATSDGRLYSSAGLTDEIVVYVTMLCYGTPAIKPGVGSEQIKVHLLDSNDAIKMLAETRASNRPMSARLWLVLHSLATTGGFGLGRA